MHNYLCNCYFLVNILQDSKIKQYTLKEWSILNDQ